MITLEDSSFCRRLSEADQLFIAQKAIRHRYEPGHVIFQEGDTGDGLYVIIDGIVEIYARSSPERHHTLSRLEAGDYFGEMATFDGGARSASARTVTVSELDFIPAAAVLVLLDRSPMLSASLVRDASHRMREFNRRFLRESLNAERVNLVERLAGTIVHDFRNPLNVIGLAADIAAGEGATAEIRRGARDRIRKQIEFLNQMMQELLEFTRSTPQKAVLPRVNYAEFIGEILPDLHAEAVRYGIDFLVEGRIPSVELRFNPARLRRVFNNLAQNAFDAMAGATPARMTLRFSEEAGFVATEVADTGRGIQRDYLSHVFEPFFTFGKAHGTGLGLAICDRIIREHEGSIDVWSELGRGSTFRFRLPLSRPGDTDLIRQWIQT